jgi:transcriptional regulator with XRE-family HTH domain
MSAEMMKELRLRAGLTQAQMADLMGLGKTAYVDLEADEPEWKKFKERHLLALERASLKLAVERRDISLALPAVRRDALDLAKLIRSGEGPKIRTPNVRQFLFPYGMAKNPDGSWTFFNRHYKVVGLRTDEWSEWDHPQHKVHLKGLGPATLAKLDVNGGDGTGDTIYFYNDRTNPEGSAENMTAYLAKLRTLLGLQASEPITRRGGR